MPNYEDDDDYGYDDGDIQASSSLAEVRKALRKQQRQNKELTEALEGFRKEARKATVTSALQERGLSPKIAAFVPSDVEADGIASWLDEFGDVFAPAGASSQTSPGDQSGPDPAVVEAQRFNEVASQGKPPSGDEAQLAALISGAKSPEELNQILFGNPNGPAIT